MGFVVSSQGAGCTFFLSLGVWRVWQGGHGVGLFWDKWQPTMFVCENCKAKQILQMPQYSIFVFFLERNLETSLFL